MREKIILFGFTEEEFKSVYLALWTHKRKMWEDYTDEKFIDAFAVNEKLIDLFKFYAERENVEI
jgi:hypothetical protein